MNEAKYFLCRLIYDYLDFLENIKGLSKNTTTSYQRDLNKLNELKNQLQNKKIDLIIVDTEKPLVDRIVE